MGKKAVWASPPTVCSASAMLPLGKAGCTPPLLLLLLPPSKASTEV